MPAHHVRQRTQQPTRWHLVSERLMLLDQRLASRPPQPSISASTMGSRHWCGYGIPPERVDAGRTPAHWLRRVVRVVRVARCSGGMNITGLRGLVALSQRKCFGDAAPDDSARTTMLIPQISGAGRRYTSNSSMLSSEISEWMVRVDGVTNLRRTGGPKRQRRSSFSRSL